MARLEQPKKVILAALVVGIAALAVYFVPQQLREPGSMLTAVELILFGVAVGAYGTMVGVGGGFLIVPALLLAFHATPQQAAGTSLTVVFLNAASGTLSYARHRRVDYRAGLWFAGATVPGAIVGAHLSDKFSGPTFNMAFGILLLLLSIILFWRPQAEEEIAEALIEEAEASRWHVVQNITDAGGETFRYRYDLRIGITLSFVVGFFSSVLGIGGGVIHVPVLVHLLDFPTHMAIATSQFILAISALVGAVSHMALGHVMFGPAVLMGIGVIVGAQIGALIGRRLRGTIIVRLLSVALVAVGVRLLLS
jgi:uncharacterized protein